jgi:hypothetical protein
MMDNVQNCESYKIDLVFSYFVSPMGTSIMKNVWKML